MTTLVLILIEIPEPRIGNAFVSPFPQTTDCQNDFSQEVQ